MNPVPPPQPETTPGLTRLLRSLRTRLTRQVWLHGLGTVAIAAAAWLAFAFVADWGLRVPRAIRILHGVTWVALPAVLAWRHLVRPLRRMPDDAGLALLIERKNPQLHELLVSAVQLQRKPDGDPQLVEKVLAEADSQARQISLAGVLDERGPRRRFGLGAALASAAVAAIALSPLHGGILFDRMLGRSTAWPQRTHLAVELPNAANLVELEPGRFEVRVARGSDVPVVVRAQGVVPATVELNFDDGQQMELSRGGDDSFHTLLRNCQDDIAFDVTGGDDRDGLPAVTIIVLQPPDVLGVAVRIEPPAYSGREPRTEWDRDVVVLAGSQLSVHMLSDPERVQGIARVLPEDRVVELSPAPFPHPPGTNPATAPGYVFQLEPMASLRYRLELVDDQGLSNPDPGLFAVDVIEDQSPEVTLITPRRSDVDAVLGGLVPVHIRAQDDFGLTEVLLTTRVGIDEARTDTDRVLTLSPPSDAGPGPLRRGYAIARLEVDDVLASGATEGIHRSFQLVVTAHDNRLPEPGVGRSSEVSVRIISPDELLRRVQDRLSRARLQASELAELQRSKRTDSDDLLQALKGDSPLLDEDTLALQSALSGQRRVLGDARSLARDLASIAETVIYARLDDKAGILLERLDRLQADETTEVGFQSSAWRALAAALQNGEVGSPGFAGHLVELVSLSLEIESDHALLAVEALDRAQNAVSAADVFTHLFQAEEIQGRTLARIEDLLERLAEWDNFQSVLLLTRDILNRQEALRDRTKQYASDK